MVVGACPQCFPPRKPAPAPAVQSERFTLKLVDVTKPCADCGRPYTTQAIVMGDRPRDFGRICEACTNAAAAAEVSAKQAAFVAARKAQWEFICPEFYRTDAIKAALPEAKRALVSKLFKEHGGCLIHGPSGAFKTTVAFHSAVKPLIWAKEDVKFISAMEWKPRCSAAAKECRTEQFLAPFARVPHLFLDDLGNMGGTPASIEALHLLTEKRMRSGLPLIATTQFSGAELIAKLSGREGEHKHAAVAIVRRLALICRITIPFT